MFMRAMLAILTTFSIQQAHAVEAVVVQGDQSGLLADLYHAKNDYHNIMSKGMLENNDLLQMMRNIHSSLSPYVGQQVLMSAAWSLPIWQTTADFRIAFGEENRSLLYALDILTLRAQHLASLKRMDCAYLNPRFQLLIAEMNRIWQARDLDSRTLIDQLESVAEEADRSGGYFVVRESWLNNIFRQADSSERKQIMYRADFYQLDRTLESFLEEVRACYSMD